MTLSAVGQQLLKDAATIMNERTLSPAEVNKLVDQLARSPEAKDDDLAAFAKLANDYVDRMDSAESAGRLLALSRLGSVAMVAAVRDAERNDGVIDDFEISRIAKGIADGSLRASPIKTSLAALMVAAKVTPQARAYAAQVGKRDAQMQAQASRTGARNLSELAAQEATMASAAQSASYQIVSGVTVNCTSVGNKLFVGDWVGQAFHAWYYAGAEDFVVLANSLGDTRLLKGDVARTYLSRPAELNGRAVYELLGAPTDSYGFANGSITQQSSWMSPAVSYQITDPALAGIRSDLGVAEAAQLLSKSFDAVAGASSGNTAVISKRDLELVASDSTRPIKLRSAAATLVSSGKLGEVELATGKLFGDDCITREDLTAAMDDGTRPLRTRQVVLGSVYAQDYMDTSGPLATPLGRARSLSLSVRAAPGATINVYNRTAPKDGEPAKLTSLTVSRDAGPLGPDGLVEVNVNVPSGSDWLGGDRLAVTQQLGNRAESVPVETLVQGAKLYYPRPLELHADRILLGKDGIVSTQGDYAMTPYRSLRLIKDGLDTGITVEADAFGRFSLPLPGPASSAAWELRGDGKVRVALSGELVDPAKKFADWVAKVRHALFVSPENGRIAGRVTGLLPGLSVSVQNPANGPQTYTFTADAKGTMAIDIPSVGVADVLNITLAPISMADYQQPAVNYRLAAPTKAEAKRIDLVLDKVTAVSERERFFALDLFGPTAPTPELAAVSDAKQMNDLFTGARMGAYLAANGSKRWLEQVQAQVTAAGLTDVAKGLALGTRYRGGHTPDSAALGFKLVQQGQTRIVATGGYSPISGSHGPLTPEYVTGPSTWELSWLNLPALTLMTDGQRPSGWVNPNAYVLTFTSGTAGTDGIKRTWTEQGNG